MKNYETKDTGIRQKFESGFVRDSDLNKPRYDLIPHELLYRLAMLYTRGAQKYDDQNWRKANSKKEYDRFKASAFRHFMQWQAGEEDEDHAVAAIWNIIAYEWHTQHKPNRPEDQDQQAGDSGTGRLQLQVDSIGS